MLMLTYFVSFNPIAYRFWFFLNGHLKFSGVATNHYPPSLTLTPTWRGTPDFFPSKWPQRMWLRLPRWFSSLIILVLERQGKILKGVVTTPTFLQNLQASHPCKDKDRVPVASSLFFSSLMSSVIAFTTGMSSGSSKIDSGLSPLKSNTCKWIWV